MNVQEILQDLNDLFSVFDDPKDKFIQLMDMAKESGQLVDAEKIDTNKIETQEFVLKKGAHIINDIFGGNEDLFYLTKKYHSGVIIMHTQHQKQILQKKNKSNQLTLQPKRHSKRKKKNF